MRRGAKHPRVIALLTLCCVAAACTTTRSVEPEPAPERVRRRGEATSSQCRNLDRLLQRVRRGYVPKLSPDISVIPREPNYVGSAASPVHSGPWDYLAEVPLVLYGPGYIRPAGEIQRPADMADLAPTTGRLIGFALPPRWDGRVLDEAFEKPSRPPKLVVTIVWDGGGWNVLREHPTSWPFLGRLMQKGASYTRFTIGSSPSVTPPIHTTLGTGVYPRRHGIPGLKMRDPSGEYVDPFLGFDAANIDVPTLADLYDAARGDRPVVGMLASVSWHLGMIGKGAASGGDRDLAPLLRETGEIFGNNELYEVPPLTDLEARDRAIEQLDRADGNADMEWRGHPLEEDLVTYASPAQVRYQELLLERLVTQAGFGADAVPDLLYVNFKSGDDAGHNWGLTSPEVGEVVSAKDQMLRRFTRFLDRAVGVRRWVVLLTADHGQTPYPDESGAWPVGGAELARDVNAVFDDDDDVPLVDRVSSPGLYVNPDELRSLGLSLKKLARWVARYTVIENLKEGESLPRRFEEREEEPLFDATMVRGALAATSCRR